MTLIKRARWTDGWALGPLLLGAVICAASLVSVVDAEPALAGGAKYDATYVALGDSYAAGEGLGSTLSDGGYEPGTAVPGSGKPNKNPKENICHRSMSSAYGSVHQSNPVVLPSLPMSKRSFWACSGATTADMMSDPGAEPIFSPGYEHGQPEQIDTVGPDTKWISVSVGGDDIGFSKIGSACASLTFAQLTFRVSSGASCATVVARAAAQLPKLGVHLVRLYEDLLQRAPNAVLAVAGYPRIFPTSYKDAYETRLDHTKVCLTNVFYSDAIQKIAVGVKVSDAKLINQDIIIGLNDTIWAAIKTVASEPEYAGRIAYADSYDRSDDVPQNCTGHTNNVTVNGVVLSPGANGINPHTADRWISTATFHPTKAGQKVLGQAVQAAFTSLASRNSILLPFGTLTQPTGIAVDTQGNVFVADNTSPPKILELVHGTSTPTVLPFSGLDGDEGLAVDAAGDLFVADTYNDRVLELAHGSTSPVTLPFAGLGDPDSVAVDKLGDIFVADLGDGNVFELPEGSAVQVQLPFGSIPRANGVAVDRSGNVFVSELDFSNGTDNSEVLELRAGASAPITVPFSGIYAPYGLATDAEDDVFVADPYDHRVLELAPGSTTQAVTPLGGETFAYAIAVDEAGDIFVADAGENDVIEVLAAR